MTAIKQQLQLKQSQSLVLTADLQQAIALLQLSQTELDTVIDEAILENPILEKEDPFERSEAGNTDTNASESESDNPPLEYDSDNLWQEQSFLPNSQNKNAGGDDFDFIQNLSEVRTLKAHLFEQIPLVIEGYQEQFIAQFLVDSVDPFGYLQLDLSDAASELNCDIEKIETILSWLQERLEPTGVLARDLSECLRLQLKERGGLTERLGFVLDRLTLVKGYDFSALKKQCAMSEEELCSVIGLFRTLNPKPGQAFDSPLFDAVEPDVLVFQTIKKNWRVELNERNISKLSLNKTYMNLPKEGLDKKSKAFMNEKKKAAHWLVRSVEQRYDTILRVACEIVSQQKDFFEKGIAFLKPLKLEDIARALSIHESTVSRVTTHKFLESPRGFFELKYFFNSGLKRTRRGANDVSSKTVQAAIKKWIINEPAAKPYSDDKLVKLLKSQAIQVARRTIAKYREQLGIASSVERKNIKQNRF